MVFDMKYKFERYAHNSRKDQYWNKDTTTDDVITHQSRQLEQQNLQQSWQQWTSGKLPLY